MKKFAQMVLEKIVVITLIFSVVFGAQNVRASANTQRALKKYIQKYKNHILVGVASSVLTAATIALIHHTVKTPWAKTTHPWHANLRLSQNTENYVLFQEKQKRDSEYYKQFEPSYLGDLAIIFVPGLGDQPNVVAPMNHYELFPTDHFYVVNLEDTNLNHRVLATSFGQESDVLPVLKTLKVLWESYEKLLLFGESRGGATVINAIAVLHDKEHPLLQEAEITEELRVDILRKLKNGGIVLRAPLLSMKTTTDHNSVPLLGQALLYLLGAPLTGYRFNPFKKEPVDTVLQWKIGANQSNIPTLVIFPETDEVLGNRPNEQFMENLRIANGQEYSRSILAATSSHLKTASFECDRIVREFIASGLMPKFNEWRQARRNY